MTKSQRMRESAVMISSTMPSTKYSCSGSPLILAKGSTAIDGLSGSGSVAGIGQGLDPRGDVDAVTIDVVALDDHVAEIDADAQLDAVVCRDIRVPVGHRLLHRDRAAHRIDDAGKFHQQAVAGGLDDAAMMLGDFRIDELA